MTELDTARYISLTTYKRDGSPVATPVWVTGADGAYAFTTGATAWKARRLQHTPAIQVQVCDRRGRVQPGATVYSGTGEVAPSAEAVAAAERALAAKYGWQFRLLTVLEGLRKRLGRGSARTSVAIQLSITEPSSSS